MLLNQNSTKMMLLSIILAIISNIECANILFVAPFSAKSHNIALRPLGLELAQRGHNVTVWTSFPEPNRPANYHEVVIAKFNLTEQKAAAGIKTPNSFELADMSTEQFFYKIAWVDGPLYTENILKCPSIQEFLAKDHKFDIVIVEQFIIDAINMLAHKYQAPLITISTFGNAMKHNFALRNPLQQATVVSEYLMVKDPASFWGRLRNFYFNAIDLTYWFFRYIPQQEELVKKYIPNLPQPVPSLYEIEQNTVLTLYNSHFSFDPPTAYLPNIVEIGGLHLTKGDGKIPEDLQTILDKSTNGVVYVNFGSNINSTDLPEEKRYAFVNVFRKLKQTVLWKWEDDTIKDLPKNVVIRKWFPQKEILAHKNIKVFFSHGGLIGTQEAVFHGVPIIGIPVFGDQYNNLLQVQDLGMGKVLPYHDIDEKNIESLLVEVLSNDSYGKKAKEISNRFMDRPMSPLDTAVFWIEYVIRHKGADFMKNPALNLSWIAYSMLDVYAFVLLLLTAALYLPYLLIRKICSLNHSISNKQDLRNKKNK